MRLATRTKEPIMTNISYDRETVLEEIQYVAGHQLPRLADHYLDEAEAFRKVYDQAKNSEAACSVAQAARAIAKLHADSDSEFSTEVYLTIVFHTLRMTRGY
jgi:hypothetical protein